MFSSWSHPWFFLFVPLAAILLAFRPAWRRPIALDLPTAEACRDLTPRPTLGRRLFGGSLLAAAYFTVVALAGPLSIRQTVPVVEGISLAFVVDVSGSMATPDFSLDGAKVSRLAGVQSVFRLLVAGGETPEGLAFPGRPNDLLSLVVFAARPDTACPPTLDHRALLEILDRQKPRTVVGDATTNPGDALAWALAALEKAPTRRKAIVFLTDGESNVPPPALSPRQAGELAASLGVPIYCIDALDDAEAGADAPKAHASLADLARVTGGRWFRAADGRAMREALHELDRLERDAVARPDETVFGALSGEFAALAFVFWLMSVADLVLNRRRAP